MCGNNFATIKIIYRYIIYKYFIIVIKRKCNVVRYGLCYAE